MPEPLPREILAERLGVPPTRNRRGQLCARASFPADRPALPQELVERVEAHPAGYLNLWLSPRAFGLVLHRLLTHGVDRLEVPAARIRVSGEAEWGRRRSLAVQASLEALLGGGGPEETLLLGPTEALGRPGSERAVTLACLWCAPRKACRLRFGAGWTEDPWERLEYALLRLDRLPAGDPPQDLAPGRLSVALENFPYLRREAARTRNPALLAHFAVDLADAFHDLYRTTHLFKDPAALALCRGVRTVLAACLVDLGF